MSRRADWPVELTWGELALRPLTRRDRAQWDEVRWANREWLGPWEATSPEPAEVLPSFAGFVRRQDREAREGRSLLWVITERHPGSGRHDLVGQLSVSSILGGAARSASIGYWVDGRCAGRGIAPMAVAMAVDHCFRVLRLHRIEINIRPGNAASLRIVEKLGFREEGLRRDYLHIAGSWADHRSFALTAPEAPPEGLVARFTGSDEPVRRVR